MPVTARLTGPALCVMLALSACGGTPATGAATLPTLTESLPAATGELDTLRWALHAEPSTLDPMYPSDLPPLEVLANVCESLVKIEPDFSYTPALAESWSSPDPLTLVYELRPGVKFHSGAELTAKDVAYSLSRHLDKSLGSYYGAVYQNVKDIRATGDLEVTVRFKAPDALFHQSMATAAGRILGKAASEAAGKDLGKPGEAPDCTGPLKLGTWTTGQSITLDRFDAYWDAAHRAKTGHVRFDFIRDPAAAITALLAGELDGSWYVPSSGFARLRATDTGTLYFGRTSGSYVAMVTDLNGALGDVRIRKALSLAIDRRGIVKAAVAGAAEPLKAPAAPGSWGFEKEALRAAYDALPDPGGRLEEARALVREAGVPSAPVTIAVTGSQAEMPVIGAEVKRAGESIGLKVEIRTLPADNYNALYSDAEARKGIDLIFSLWQTDFPDPTQIYQYLQTGDTFNYARWSNPEYDRLVTEAASAGDPAQRAKLVVGAQDIAVKALIWIPLYAPFNTLFLGKGLTGAPTSSVQITYPWAADIGRSG
ncbi:ABC transporter substrate-binding protein [Microtetraspora niveoalba]|uniref:ABC transporter substrate-binding protein n=1 Tax=Microtetraspora niveoalba TaxID=46175 RepID=UPI0008313FF1|nr:ABC transporter substrate-binding protein [Microtetraspora niveoalba]